MLPIASVLLLALLAPPPTRRVASDPHFLARKFKYKCDLCSIKLEKKKHLEEHERGKRHRLAVERADSIWQRYRESSWYHPDAPRSAVVNAFSFNQFLDGLVRRTRMGGPPPLLEADGDGCLSPHVTLASLDASKRAMLFRYLDESCGATEYASVLLQLEADHGSKYTRIKELLESVEAYKLMRELVTKRPESNDNGLPPQALGGIHDVACGHGLAGLLLAAHYPEVPLVSSDLQRRESYDAHLAAWSAIGRPLSNAKFVQGNFTELYHHQRGGAERITPNSLVVCIHGCNEASRAAVDLARGHGAGWMVVPCCMPNAYAPRVQSLRLDDETRYALLCGALAESHEASIVWSLPERVTPRSIVLADTCTKLG